MSKSVREQVETVIAKWTAELAHCESLLDSRGFGPAGQVTASEDRLCDIRFEAATLLNEHAALFASAEELRQENARLKEQAWQLAFMLNRAVGELNAIRARDGVPHTSQGQPYGVTLEYFSSIIDDSWAALEAHGTPYVPWDLKRPESLSPQPVQGGGE